MAINPPRKILARIEGLPIIAVFLVLLVLFMWLAPRVFLQPYQYTTFMSTLPPIILLAVGLTFVIGAGEIDLCFPAILGVSGYVFAVIFQNGQADIVAWLGAKDTDWIASYGADQIIQWIAVVAARAAGVLVGFINGVLVARIGIPSFIATLGTQFLWYGIASIMSGGLSYALRGAEGSSVWMTLVGRPFTGSSIDWVQQVPLQALWTLLIVVFMWFIRNRHRFGEHTLFLGDSNAVSAVVGIDVVREKIKLFTLMGLLSGLAAIFLTLEN
jgi:simple sugar transport system permease protein